MAWVIAWIDNPPPLGSIMVRQGHAGAWEAYHPDVDQGELQSGVLERINEGCALIQVSGEIPRASVGLHLEEAVAAGLLQDLEFVE